MWIYFWFWFVKLDDKIETVLKPSMFVGECLLQ